jgi:glycosyltransferase involved in cell wall biosynthesis
VSTTAPHAAAPLNLFYEQPENDRWVRYDRYPRRVLRRLVRGKPPVMGHERVFVNLCDGLRQLGVPFRVNDYRYARQHPEEPVGIVGKPVVIDWLEWRNPIVFGPAIYSHPLDDLDLLTRRPVHTVLVQGEWMRRMCEPYWGDRVLAWPVGVDTDWWSDASTLPKSLDVLVYDKIRWERERCVPELLERVTGTLRDAGLAFDVLRYGTYREDDYHALLGSARAMVFLCEHETQGFAYQQALARGVPVFAWDRGGVWQDPAYYPDRVQFGPVSSVPNWDDRCGMRFADAAGFVAAFPAFHESVVRGRFNPRALIVEELTLAQRSRQYVEIFERARPRRAKSA